MVKQRRQMHSPLLAVSQHLYVGAVAVTVQYQKIHHQHLIDVRFPSVPDAELEWGLAFHMLAFPIGIQGDFVLSPFFKIFGGAEEHVKCLSLTHTSAWISW